MPQCVALPVYREVLTCQGVGARTCLSALCVYPGTVSVQGPSPVVGRVGSGTALQSGDLAPLLVPSTLAALWVESSGRARPEFQGLDCILASCLAGRLGKIISDFLVPPLAQPHLSVLEKGLWHIW